MAGARAAASLSLTIAVAFATLLVVGGILAGPAIRDCWGDAGRLGACLHGKLEQGGVLPEAPRLAQQQVLSSELPPPIVAETPHRSGWIEANATEYEMPPGASVTLEADPGAVSANGVAPSAAEVTAEIALAAPAGNIETTGSITGAAPLPAETAVSLQRGQVDAGGAAATLADPEASVALVEPAGTLSASGAATVMPSPIDVAISHTPAGEMSANGATEETALTATAEPAAVTPSLSSPLLSIPTAGGVAIGGPTGTAVGTLEAEPAPLPAKRPIIAAPPKPEPATTAAASPKFDPAAPNPKAIIKFNRRYPDVVVLPPPSSGADSSFATLQLR